MSDAAERDGAEVGATATGPRRSGRLPVIDPKRCTGCGRCVAVCRPHVLSLEVIQWEKVCVLHDPPGCTGCNQCAINCPFHAITMQHGQPPDELDPHAQPP
jgi:MinD superfamily P-loop ATPase